MDGDSVHYTGGSEQDHPQEKQMQKAKWLSDETLQIAEKRNKRQRRKGKIYSTACRVSENRKLKLKVKSLSRVDSL